MNNSASNAGRDWDNEVVDSLCPPWCTLAPDAHPFDLNEVDELERIHESDIELFVPAAARYSIEHAYARISAVERIREDGFAFESPTFCLVIERGVGLTPDELDRLIAMLGRWRRHLELALQAQR